MNYVTANLHGKIYYLPQDGVMQIEHMATVTKVPFAPNGVVGILPYQGEPIPVIDAFMPDAAVTALQILYQTPQGMAAYQADSIGDFCEMAEAETNPLGTADGALFSPIRVPKTVT